MNRQVTHNVTRWLLSLMLALSPLTALSDAINIEQADSYRANGKYFKANSIYYRALSEGLYTEPALYGLADSFMRMNKPEEALKRVTELLNRNPRHTPGLWLRSQIALNTGELNASLSDLEQLRQLEPDNADVWMALENIYTLQGDQQNASEASLQYQRLTAAH